MAAWQGERGCAAERDSGLQSIRKKELDIEKQGQ